MSVASTAYSLLCGWGERGRRRGRRGAHLDSHNSPWASPRQGTACPRIETRSWDSLGLATGRHSAAAAGDRWRRPAGAPHLEAHRGAALLHSLHGVLYLEDAALGAPCGDVCVILQGAGVRRAAAVGEGHQWPCERPGARRAGAAMRPDRGAGPGGGLSNGALRRVAIRRVAIKACLVAEHIGRLAIPAAYAGRASGVGRLPGAPEKRGDQRW